MQHLQMEHLTALLNKHRLRFHRIVAFRPTGWTFGGGSGMSTSKSDPSGRIRVYGVPYSEHSSFVELADCVRALNPREIIPTVRSCWCWWRWRSSGWSVGLTCSRHHRSTARRTNKCESRLTRSGKRPSAVSRVYFSRNRSKRRQGAEPDQSSKGGRPIND
jgi:hypothetical protein